ncbi:helix-turn-helix domain-containing protein [Runella sp. CRIBMP]|uniref:helix-turn-helix transcriptional regulator n=1 Tax=Runella sp. CRIBMP TaxID=2683261 RepID=UPI001412D2BA|nr:helix-turn-helix transcriptional regulator [Runella sp. CRIBMP]NBB22420.1 helix-turn-helix domain-containing protein [Runella sp. CRIBMP]
MRSQTDFQSLNSLPSAILSETFVTIHVAIDYIKDIIPFLFAQQIPFFMSSAGIADKTILDKKENISLEEELKYEISENLSRIEQVFQKYINDRIGTIPPKLEAIAEEAGVSAIQFRTLFKKRYKKTFNSYYIEAKMEYAAQLLKQGYKAVDVSKQIGYGEKSVIKFNKMFQKHFGITPKKYQQRPN